MTADRQSHDLSYDRSSDATIDRTIDRRVPRLKIAIEEYRSDHYRSVAPWPCFAYNDHIIVRTVMFS